MPTTINKLIVGACVYIFALFVMLVSIATCKMQDSKKRLCVADLIAQATQWHSLSLQDTNEVFAMRHANYAIAYMTAARRIMSDIELEQISGKNVHTLLNDMNSTQKKTVGALCKSCKRVMPKGSTISTWL